MFETFYPSNNNLYFELNMEYGLLESVRKYRPRDGTDPLENFITEAFTWILSNNPEFSKYFVEYILSNVPMQGVDSNDCEWFTQYNFGGIYPDMVCISNNKALVFENKVWSGLGNQQLENYKDYASNNFENHKLIIITATKYHHHTDSQDLALCWSDVYELIGNWLTNNKETPFIFDDFRKLLKSEGLGPPVPVSHESILYYYSSINLKDNLSNIIKDVGKKDWSKYIKQDFELLVEKKNRLAYGEAWGRMGLHLLNTWRPGIFVGVLLDVKDHCTEASNITKGPDFCIILDFDPDLHDKYKNNPHYIALINNISEIIVSIGDGWDFYNHLEDHKQITKNKWHPIHIRKPLLDVFAGTTTVEEQVDKFYNTANEIVKLIVEDNNFWLLRENYKL